MNNILREISIYDIIEEELSPEAQKVKDFFENLFDGLEEFEIDEYPGDIFFRKNGKIYMQQDSKNERLWCSNEDIWSFFKTEFEYNYNEISELIQNMLEIHLKRNVFAASNVSSSSWDRVEIHLKRKVFAATTKSYYSSKWWKYI
jgi:hypothetical protein